MFYNAIKYDNHIFYYPTPRDKTSKIGTCLSFMNNIIQKRDKK